VAKVAVILSNEDWDNGYSSGEVGRVLVHVAAEVLTVRDSGEYKGTKWEVIDDYDGE
jgi:hypothetical protein